MGMAGMTVTDERLEEVNFTTSYATGVQVIIVREDRPISSADDLSKQQLYNWRSACHHREPYATWDIEDEVWER
jgi:polar amino acid transport system substrate-binding protein